MNEKLTPEFAESVILPKNPIRRHLKVLGILADREMVGERHVVVNPKGEVRFFPDQETIIAYSIWPLPGRGVLKDVARTIEVMNERTTELVTSNQEGEA